MYTSYPVITIYHGLVRPIYYQPKYIASDGIKHDMIHNMEYAIKDTMHPILNMINGVIDELVDRLNWEYRCNE